VPRGHESTGKPSGSPQDGSKHIIRQAEAWGRENQVLLEACFAEFGQNGEWPTLGKLEHRLELAGSATSAKGVARQMPVALGFVEQERLVLLCRGLLQIDGTQVLLGDWFKSVRQAYFGWMNDPEVPFGSDQVAKVVDGDAGRLKRVSVLLLRESWMFGSGPGDANGPWSREVDSAVREAGHAANARELLDARATVEWSDFEPPSKTSWWLPLWRYVSNNPLLAGLAVVVIVAIVGIIFAAARGIFESLGSDSSGSGRVERAGEDGARSFAAAGVLGREGPSLKPGEKVRVLCRVYAPRPPSAVPDGYWYQISSSPWNGHYFAAANSFWNGDTPGHLPYTHNTDYSVQKCH
jgi:hypothetical protein